jgi:peptidoglycan/xylan/chitin deacetylase (PgdA/CDA1 family)
MNCFYRIICVFYPPVFKENKEALLRGFFVFLLLCVPALIGQNKVFTSFSSSGKEIALTFDACQRNSPVYLDTVILNYIIKEKLPVTIFLGGKFCKTNAKKLKEISEYGFIEFENHSFSHIQHMEILPETEIIKEVAETNNIIKETTGQSPRFFRFPGGNYDKKALACVNKTGMKVVHWSFASGDPDENLSAERIKDWVLFKTKPGSVLIFHINGKGYHTGEILPQLVKIFREKQYKFCKLSDVKLK